MWEKPANNGEAMTAYDEYRHLQLHRDRSGVLHITLDRPEVLNAANPRLHWEMGEIWRTFDEDPEARVALLTGAGKGFCAGGDLTMVESATVDVAEVKRQFLHTAALVQNMMATDKPIVSAINGVAVGAGAAVGLMADISIMGESARISDGHVRLGVAAGDHAAMLWPLLCGLAKAKYYLLTADFILGPEAERIGLVSLCVPDDQLITVSTELAARLAQSPQTAMHWTKRSINQWLHLAGPIFQHSLALEMLSLLDDDVREGVRSLRSRQPAVWPSTLRNTETGVPE